jgi:hypothetical protein
MHSGWLQESIFDKKILSKIFFVKLFLKIVLFWKKFSKLHYHVGCLCTQDDSSSPFLNKKILWIFFVKIFLKIVNFSKNIFEHFYYHVGCLCTQDDSMSPFFQIPFGEALYLFEGDALFPQHYFMIQEWWNLSVWSDRFVFDCVSAYS